MQLADNHLAALTSTNQASSFPPAAECLQHLQSDSYHYPKKKSNKEAFLISNFPSNCLLADTCGEHAHKARLKGCFHDV